LPAGNASCSLQPFIHPRIIHVRHPERHRAQATLLRRADGQWKSNFLINIGYGDSTGNWPRGPRLPFHTMARID
jgi:hypothetical protein